ncbi:MAG: PEP/pyruvate-binding domain-containing protein [Bacteroidales bacterium]
MSKKLLQLGQRMDFSQSAFNELMQERIRRVLIICSNYDFYMLEEDGRIDEQIFNEYVSLNLRYPPVFVHADSAKQAFEILATDKIDLVIEMLSIGDVDTFELARLIKNKYPGIPIVVLTHFSREVSLRLQNEDLSAIDYVFCWLGNADLLVAIIKLIEDRMNAENDVEKVGVQVIIMVEDSVRFISSYLPNLYKIILKQSREFMKEALNEHQKMLRMRGRPKILLANNYDDALALYNKFKFNLLGIISDVSFRKSRNRDPETREGFLLCKTVHAEDPNIPFLFQSSDITNEKTAAELGAGFIYKGSKTLSIELRNYVIRNFGFGDFIFRNPNTLEEVARATDLQSLQNLILKIPDQVLLYHTSRNEISKWLNARALFPIAQIFKFLKPEDFQSLDEMRKFIYDAIASFRISKGRGVIAEFDKATYDEYLIFCRIGEGSIGGKARGLAFLDSIVKKYQLLYKYSNVQITIPRSVVIGTDIFEEFIENNDLYKIALSDVPDEEILRHFLEASLPGRIFQDLYVLVDFLKNPVAIRSSSKLEDSHYQPFAGIYSTYMVPRISDNARMVHMMTNTIKSVYASVYYKASKAYMAATSNIIDEEKMAIIIQEVCGSRYGNHFYPTFSGVARSINFYPLAPEKPEDGIVSVAFGLGKYIVDGGTSLRFSPKYPKKILQLSSPETALRETQKLFYAIDLTQSEFVPATDDSANLLKLSVKEAENNPVFRHVASTYDLESGTLRDGIQSAGKRIVTFAGVLQHNTFPLAEILSEILQIGQREMNNPIEIEFAVNLDVPGTEPAVFNLLQIRPIVLSEQTRTIEVKPGEAKNIIVYSEMALGHGNFENLCDVIYLKPETFNASKTSLIAERIEKLNQKMKAEKKNYVLIGPGRWGSSDPWLGIPVKWPQISEARIIIESGLDQYRIDPSQGTHFFQNLTSFHVGYMTVNMHRNEGKTDVDFLNRMPAVYEDEFIRHVRFEKPLVAKIDGRKNVGIIYYN